MVKISNFVLSVFLVTFQVYHGSGQFVPQTTGPNPSGQFIVPAVIEPILRPCQQNPYPPSYNDFYVPPPPPPQQIIILDDGGKSNNGIDDILLLFILASKNKRGGGLFGGCGCGCGGNNGCGGCNGCDGGCYGGSAPPISLIITTTSSDADSS